MRIFSALLFCALIVATPVSAKDEAAPFSQGGDEQIEVTAEDSLEWYADQQLYVARGKAVATRGNMKIEADILTAHERDKTGASPDKGADGQRMGGGNIDKLTAEGNVHIVDPRQEVFGDRAVYDFDSRVSQVTGGNLKYITAHDVVTARDSLEYHEEKNMAIARGKAVAVHDQRKLEADVLTAHFIRNAAGQMDLTQMTAEGHVTVLTATDVARGEKAVYDVKRNVAVLSGNVRVTRNDTQLTGDKAEVNFASGQSRLLNEGKGRVRALLLPKSGATQKDAARIDTSAKADQKAGRKAGAP